VHVKLEAFSPFIPSNVEDSSYPATVLNYTVENTSREPVECTVGGWMENAAGIAVRNQGPIVLQNGVSHRRGFSTLNCGLAPQRAPNEATTIFDDFASGKYDHWQATGNAFGTQPAKLGDLHHRSPIPVVGAQGQYLINSVYRVKDKNGDTPTGTLTSESFVIGRRYLLLLVGGGNDPERECGNLLIDGKAVRSATGNNDEILRLASWEVSDLSGKTARLQVVDRSDQRGGHILVGEIGFSDTPDRLITVGKQSDVGSMALTLLADDAEVAARVTGPSAAGCLNAPAASGAAKRSLRARK